MPTIAVALQDLSTACSKYLIRSSANRRFFGDTVTVPTVLRVEGFRIFFYSGDRSEPMQAVDCEAVG